MKRIHITVIGSGSTYCPELVDGLIQRASSLEIGRLVFMDIDERKRTIVGDLCVRMLRKAGISCEVVMTDDLDEALKGADFVVTQMRVGKLPARHLDETIPLKYGLIGQETTGIGGFFKALRTIPVMQNITDRMQRLCPEAWLINFTNPAGIMTEFVLNHTPIKSIGLCNVPINMLNDVREKTASDAQVTYLGLNHLSWITSVRTKDGEQIGQLLEEGFSAKAMANIKDDGFDPDWLKTIRAIPSSYLQYFYCREAKMEHLKKEEKSRAEVCMEIEEQLLQLYSDPSVDEKPALLDKRGGHKYSLAAVSLIDSIANDKGDDHVVNIRNGGALSFMEPDDIVEITAKIGFGGAVPYPVTNFDNRHIITMMLTVKAYEKLTVEAALSGSDRLALQALMLNPLLGDYQKTKACFEEMKEAHREYLSRFYQK